nr:MAG TPA: hypothetical protein [Caudoviricetes sp.]
MIPWKRSMILAFPYPFPPLPCIFLQPFPAFPRFEINVQSI